MTTAHDIDLRRGYFRIFGLTAHRLLIGFPAAAMNVVTLRYRHLERNLPDPWGTVLREPEPEPRRSPSRGRGSSRPSRPGETAAQNGT